VVNVVVDLRRGREMNKNEKVAYNWLRGIGYSDYDIDYKNNRSPDFILSDGTGYEHKILNSHTITLSDRQWITLLNCKNCYLVPFYPNGKEPVYVIPMSELPYGTKYYKDIYIYLTKTSNNTLPHDVFTEMFNESVIKSRMNGENLWKVFNELKTIYKRDKDKYK